jgi:predicted peroxiredoxin
MAKILVVLSSIMKSDQANNTKMALATAAAAVDAGREVAIVLLKDSVALAWKGTQKTDTGLGFSPIPDLIQKIVEANVPVYFENTSTTVLGISEKDIMSLNGTLIDMVKFAELISESSVVSF